MEIVTIDLLLLMIVENLLETTGGDKVKSVYNKYIGLFSKK